MLHSVFQSKSGKYFSPFAESIAKLNQLFQATEGAVRMDYKISIPGYDSVISGSINRQVRYAEVAVPKEIEKNFNKDGDSFSIKVSVYTDTDAIPREFDVDYFGVMLTPVDFSISPEDYGQFGVEAGNGYSYTKDGEEQALCHVDAYYGCTAFGPASPKDGYSSAAMELYPLNTVINFAASTGRIMLFGPCTDKWFKQVVAKVADMPDGLASALKLPYITVFTTKKNKFEVPFVNAADIVNGTNPIVKPDEDKNVTPNKIQNAQFYDQKFWFKDPVSGKKTPFFINQSGILIDGIYVAQDDFLKLLQSIALIECSDVAQLNMNLDGLADETADDGWVFHVVRDPTNHWILKNSRVSDFWKANCYNNSRFDEVFGRYQASIDALYISKGSIQGRLAANGLTFSCCALSCSFILSSIKGTPTFFSMLQVVPQLFDQKVIVVSEGAVADSKDMIGGGLFDNITVEVDGEVISGVRRSVATLNDVKSHPKELYLMKLKKPGAKYNHWIVIYFDGENLVCRYDPLRTGNFFDVGAVVDSYVNGETEFFRFTRALNDKEKAKEGGK